jgi:hypothetical protein
MGGGRFWAASRAKAASFRPNETSSGGGANSVRGGGQAPSFTEPQPRLSACSLVVFSSGPGRLTDPDRFKLVERKPSPEAKLA